MNIKALQAVAACLFLAYGNAAFCQGGASLASETALASVEASIDKTAPSHNVKPTTVRAHKRFPQLFTGLAIEIATSTYPMDRTDPVFQQFGNVLFEKLPEGGYSYLIMANFSSKEAGLDFLQKVIKPKAEKARLIQFTEGNRKVVRE